MPETIARNRLDAVNKATDAFLHLRAVARALGALLYADRDGRILGEDTTNRVQPAAAVRQSVDIARLSEYLADQLEVLCDDDQHGRPYLLFESPIGYYRSIAKLAQLEADDTERGGDGIYGLCEAMMANAKHAWEDVFYGGTEDTGALAKWEAAFGNDD